MMGLLLTLSLSGLADGPNGGRGADFHAVHDRLLAFLPAGLASLQEPDPRGLFRHQGFRDDPSGMSRSITTAGTFMGPIIAGFLYDLTHSYTIAFSDICGG